MVELGQFRAILLDMNGTFMFGEDRFGEGEDFAKTYHGVGGRLPPQSATILKNPNFQVVDPAAHGTALKWEVR